MNDSPRATDDDRTDSAGADRPAALRLDRSAAPSARPGLRMRDIAPVEERFAGAWTTRLSVLHGSAMASIAGRRAGTVSMFALMGCLPAVFVYAAETVALPKTVRVVLGGLLLIGLAIAVWCFVRVLRADSGRGHPVATSSAWRRGGPLLGFGVLVAALVATNPPADFIARLSAVVPVLAASLVLVRGFVHVSAGDLEIEFVPADLGPGRQFMVRLAIGEGAAAVRRVEVVLACLGEMRRELGFPVMKWLAEDRVHLTERQELPTAGAAIEIPFAIPVDAPPPTVGTGPRVQWSLFVRVWSGFGSYAERFELPWEPAAS